MNHLSENYSKITLYALLITGVFFAIFYKLDSVPPLWWDEGWTMSIARNWVEEGVYGRLRDDMPYGVGLAGHPPILFSVALSFNTFGVGAWQGRLPGSLLTLGALGALFFLAERIYNRQIACGALFLVLLTPINEYIHPIFAGKQVLGEIPALFYLLTGYVFLYIALGKKSWWIVFSIIFWAIAIRSKAQEPYFWMVSLLVPLIGVVIKRWYREGVVIILGIVGVWLFSKYGLAWIESLIIAGRNIHGEGIQGAISALAVVPSISIRLEALQLAIAYCWLPIAGIGWASYQSLVELKQIQKEKSKTIVRWALMVFSGAWFAWYILLAIYWERYLLQANFVGAIFASAFLGHLTKGFNLRYLTNQAIGLFNNRRSGQFDIRKVGVSLGSFALIFWLFAAILLTIFFQLTWFLPSNFSTTQETAIYLNEITTDDDLIETYESELFLYLEHPYHYPPDQISLDLARRKHIDMNTRIQYDALAADPDYLVTGKFDEYGDLYAPWINSGDFQLLKEFSGYRIYERVRRQ